MQHFKYKMVKNEVRVRNLQVSEVCGRKSGTIKMRMVAAVYGYT